MVRHGYLDSIIYVSGDFVYSCLVEQTSPPDPLSVHGEGEEKEEGLTPLLNTPVYKLSGELYAMMLLDSVNSGKMLGHMLGQHADDLPRVQFFLFPLGVEISNIIFP